MQYVGGNKLLMLGMKHIGSDKLSNTFALIEDKKIISSIILDKKGYLISTKGISELHLFKGELSLPQFPIK